MKKIEIKIPDIAENVESGIIAGILVSEGDEVTEDQSLVEVETDKATTDIPSTHAGTVDEILVEEGDEVTVSQVIIRLNVENGEEADAEEKPEKDQKPEEDKDDEPGKQEDPEKNDGHEKEEEKDKESEKDKGRESTGDERDAEGAADKEEKEESSGIAATPLVRRIAREEGIDLSRIEGSGPNGRITREDLEKQQPTQKRPDKEDAETDAAESGMTREKLPTIRKLTAERMAESWNTVPHVTQFDETDMSALEEFRQRQKAAVESAGGKLTLTALLLKVSAFALKRFPRFASQLDESGENLLYHNQVHIGIAVDTERGLMVPVVRDVDRKSLTELSVELTDLAERARNKKISPDELQGGVFTISNLGGIGGTQFTPIVYAPQVAILGVSRGQYRQVYRNDEFQKRLMLPLSLSYDHRVIDGAEGARFLRWICQVLEDPFAILQ